MMSHRLDLAARTEKGRQRATNEDTFLIADLATGARHGPMPVRTELASANGVALAVVDASGSGFFAATTGAELAAEAMRHALTGAPSASKLPLALRAASAAIVAEMNDDPTREQRAAATLAVIASDSVHLAHIGGTRAYLLESGGLRRLTRDDTLAADAVARSHRLDFGPVGDGTLVPTRWLGAKSTDVEDAVDSLELRGGDTLLLSTVGLHLVLDDAMIERVLGAHSDPGAACDALYDAAMRAGGPFNISIVVARQVTAAARRDHLHQATQ